MTGVTARLRTLPLRGLTGGALLLGTLPLLAGSGAASAPRPLRPTVYAAAADAGDLRWLDRLDLARLRRAAAGRPAASTGAPTVTAPSPARTSSSPSAPPALLSSGGIPPVVFAAYRSAAATLARMDPSCHLGWPLLAGIGRVESNHAASGGSGQAGWDGDARPPILGPILDGTGGSAAIADTDGGRLDGNTRWDRAVGPMQFLPSTWRLDGRDGNDDGRADPENIADAALAAGGYLCAGSVDLRNHQQLAGAVFSYNHSLSYVRLVLQLAAGYAQGGTAFVELPAAPSSSARPATTPTPGRRSPTAAPTSRSASPRPSGTSSSPTSPSPSPTSPSPAPTSASPSPSQSPTSPAPSSPPGSAWSAVFGSGASVSVDAIHAVHGLPQLPRAGDVGWWTASAAPGGRGTTVLVAAAGTSARPGLLDPRSLPIKSKIAVTTPSGTTDYRVVGYSTAASLPAAPHGPRQLLLVSYDQGGTAAPQLTIVRAVPA